MAKKKKYWRKERDNKGRFVQLTKKNAFLCDIFAGHENALLLSKSHFLCLGRVFTGHGFSRFWRVLAAIYIITWGSRTGTVRKDDEHNTACQP